MGKEEPHVFHNNIVDAFSVKTTCKDCVNLYHRAQNSPSNFCPRIPEGYLGIALEGEFRCSFGLWIARGSFGGSFYPIDIERWIRLCADGFGGGLDILPRTEWPKTQEE